VELLTEKEAAIIAKVHPRTIRRLISGGKLPALNFGNGGRRKVYRIDPAAPKQRKRLDTAQDVGYNCR